MRKLIFTSVILSIAASSVILNAGWSRQQIPAIGYELTAIHAFADRSLIAVGDFGRIIYSDDQFVSWNRRESLTEELLTDIDFFNELTGLIVGQRATLLRSTDGGLSWSPRSLPAKINLNAIAILDSQRAVVVADGGMILYSSTAGREWELRPTGLSQDLNAIAFQNDGRCIVVGDAGSILRSDDGANSWQEISSSIEADFTTVAFSADGVATAVDRDGRVHRSDDGGLQWRQVEGLTIRDDFGQAAGFARVEFFDDATGILCGSFEGSYRTEDGGATWSKQGGTRLSPYPRFNSVAFLTPNEIVAVGAGSYRSAFVATTQNGGEKWGYRIFDSSIGKLTGLANGADSLYAVEVQSYNDVEFIDDNTGFLIGDNGTVKHTSDGGMLWQAVESGVEQQLTDIEFYADNAIAVGASATVIYSSNGGSTWHKASLPLQEYSSQRIRFSGLCMTSAAIAWIAGEATVNDKDRGILLKSIDGGATWERVRLDGADFDAYVDISFADELNGWLSGPAPPRSESRRTAAVAYQRWRQHLATL